MLSNLLNSAIGIVLVAQIPLMFIYMFAYFIHWIIKCPKDDDCLKEKCFFGSCCGKYLKTSTDYELDLLSLEVGLRRAKIMQQEKKEEKKIYIGDGEREKCQKVIDSFVELFGDDDLLIIDVGKYGFIKLQHFNLPLGFDQKMTFVDSRSLFDNLWSEWVNRHLVKLLSEIPLENIDRNDVLKFLSKEKEKKIFNIGFDQNI